jgi:hypothetical protein
MLLHAFQEQVIVHQGSFPTNQTDLGLITSKMSAIVDLRQVKKLQAEIHPMKNKQKVEIGESHSVVVSFSIQ